MVAVEMMDLHVVRFGGRPGNPWRQTPPSAKNARLHFQACGTHLVYAGDVANVLWGIISVTREVRLEKKRLAPGNLGLCNAQSRAQFNAQLASFYAAINRGLAQPYASTIPDNPEDLLQALQDLDSLLLKNGLKPAADSPALQKIIGELYQDSDQLPGGTAGAVRNEIKTGEATGGKLHSIKATQRARQLEKLINTGTLSSKDSNLARAIMQDLRNAVAGK